MARLTLALLGSFACALDEEPIAAFESSRVRALLAYLAVEADRPHRRDALAGLLWPDSPARAAHNNLRQALSNLRYAIGDRAATNDREAAPLFLLISRDTVQFNTASDYWLDVDLFNELIKTLQEHHPTGREADECHLERVQQAIELYRGGFLEGFFLSDSAAFEEWALFAREKYHRLALDALHYLADAYAERGEHDQARAYARRQIELEPWREEAHRQLMRALALSGQRSAALAQYETCRRVLVEELGVEPAEETTDLYQQIRDGEISTTLPTFPDPSPPLFSVPPPPCPYRGLFAFREQDAAFFFGREAFTERLVETVRQQGMVAVIGPSGSGKSSVAFAGLLPHLRQEGNWTITDSRPGGRPFYNLASGLGLLLEPRASQTHRLAETREMAEALSQGDLPLLDVTGRVLDVQQAQGFDRLLLVVDQFEELYTLCPEPETRRRFLDALLMAAADAKLSSALHLILTLRADFMGQALTHRPFADALQDAALILGPMSRQELSRAIENPAKRQGVAFETGLVARILDDVGDEPGNLPLLQFALTTLWERQAGGLLTHAAYEAIGRVEGALASYADQVYNELSSTEQEGVRRVLVQMVRPGEGTEDTRRLTTRAELGEDGWTLVHRLADARLVVTDQDPAGQTTVEVVHEALIQGWERLRAWMNEDRAFRTWQERLRTALRQWETSDRDEGALLRGVLLAEAEEWAEARGADLSAPERQFLEASVQLRDQRQAMEEIRRQRELEQARALAEAERRRAEEQAKAGKRLHTLLIGLAVVFVLALAEAFMAAGQRQQAQRQAGTAEARRGMAEVAQAEALAAQATAEAGAQARAIAQAEAEAARDQAQREASLARSRELAAASIHQLGINQELAMLLATEAGRAADTVEAYGALRQSFAHPGRTLTILSGHTDIVGDAGWSPDGTCIVTAGFDGTARIWDAETGDVLAVLAVHPDREVRQASWNPDGTHLVTTDNKGLIQVWDPQTWTELAALEGHEKAVWQMAWSPDGARFVTTSNDGSARVWDVERTTQVAAFTAHDAVVRHAAWSPDGTRIVSSGDDNRARIWEAESGAELILLDGHTDIVFQAAWERKGNRIATASFDGTARVWDAETGEELMVLSGHTAGVLYAAWNGAGTRIVTASEDNTARIWDAKSGAELFVLSGHTAGIFQAVWNQAGTRVVTSSRDGTVRVWDAVNGAELAILTGHAGWVWDVEWDPDDERILTASYDCTARVWDPEGWSELVAIPGHTAGVLGAAWDGGGTRVATASEDGTARVWDAESGNELALLLGHTGSVLQAAWNRSGTRIVTVGRDGTARVWDADLREGSQLAVLASPRAPLLHAAWNPAGTQIATAEDGGSVQVWDAESGLKLVEFGGHVAGVNYVAWDGAGRRIVSASDDGRAIVSDARSGAELASLEGHAGAVLQARWNDAGTRIATAGEDGTARVWDAEGGDELAVLTGHTAPVLHVAWDEDGARIATASEDGTARVWDAESGDELVVLAGHADWVRCAVWDETGTRIVTASEDGTARVWDAESGVELLVLGTHTAGVSDAAWSEDGTRIVTSGRDGTARIWDAESGAELAVLAGPISAGEDREWRGADVQVITASGDDTARVFYVSMEDLLEIACQRAVRDMTREEWKRYMGVEAYRETCPDS